MDLSKLKAQLTLHEGKRNDMYLDSVGVPTIGVGHNLKKPLSDRAIDIILEDDIQEHLHLLDKYLPWWRSMSEARLFVLADMAFNLGVGPSTEDPTGKLLTFKNTLNSMSCGYYEEAAKGMEASLWYKQVGKRAVTLVKMMREG